MTKKVLMVCYFSPPIVASGVARSFEFAKLLPDFGWEPRAHRQSFQGSLGFAQFWGKPDGDPDGAQFRMDAGGTCRLREEALKLMREASLLYLKQAESGTYTSVAAKTCEYLATGLPILADAPPGDNADIVREYATTRYLVTSAKPQDLRDAVEKACEVRLRTRPAIHPQFAAKFSRQALTKQLATLFDRLIDPAKTS